MIENPTDRGRQSSYAMKYKKYQQQSSPRTEPEISRTEQARARLRPCIKYQTETVPLQTALPRRRRILAETEPPLMDEQPLTEVEPLPPISDQELYFEDSLEEEFETSRDDTGKTVGEAKPKVILQDQPATETETVDFSTADVNDNLLPQMSDNADPDTLPETGLEPIVEPEVPQEESEERVPEVIPTEDGSDEMESVPADAVESEVLPEDDEAEKESTHPKVAEEDRFPDDVDVEDIGGQSAENKVLTRLQTVSLLDISRTLITNYTGGQLR